MKVVEIKGDTATERNSWLKSLLSQGIYDVTFTKVNGEVRTMPCTLMPSRLPKKEINESNKSKTRSIDALSVWCLDKHEWRSFKVMNVTEVKEL